MGHLSPRELYEGNLEGGLLNWEPPKDILSKTGNGRLFPLEPRFWGTWRDTPFLGRLKEGKNVFT